ncbi:MAG: zinc metalloprotease [candidate division WS6 bacterium 36_33]|uniref:Zinc metalloprotease n=1 Tax=candidate division WS6 bacterium 36_33 TaxID=1641388 RepID=A0A101GZ35_9BACT|nr:MAG: zinc metalloprotease [candidate division WS6 bacterium 36_33]
MLSTVVNIILFIFVIGFLTLIHELGHFLAAKSVGARVYEFSVGFGPKLFSKKYGETLYCIRMIPLGGFVKILGDGDPSEYEEKGEDLSKSEYNLNNKSKIAQIFVMLAGVCMNILFAIFFYYIILAFNGWKTSPVYVDLSDVNVVAADVEKTLGYSVLEDGNAIKSGIPEYGVIKEINGVVVDDKDALTEVIEGAEEVTLLVCDEMEKECGEYPIVVNEEGKIGIFLSYGYILDYSDHKLFAGPLYLTNNLKIIGRVLSSMLGTAKETGDYSDLSNTVSGPVGIFLLIDSLKTRGLLVFISLIADLSISLAIMNILPIPALDGGRVLIVALEGIFRKDFDEKLKAIIINGSMIFLMVLVVLIMIKDVINIDTMKEMLG